MEIITKKDTRVLKIVKEDILRILGERKKETSLESVEAEIKVLRSFIFQAIKELKEKKLIQIRKNFVSLTKDGQDKAESIVKKHLVLEDFFKKTRNRKEAHNMAHLLEHYVSEEVIRNIKKLFTFKEKGLILTRLKLNKDYLITDIAVPRNELFERMVSMGIFPGEKIRIINKIPNGIIVKIKNKKYALDKAIAKKLNALEYEKFKNPLNWTA